MRLLIKALHYKLHLGNNTGILEKCLILVDFLLTKTKTASTKWISPSWISGLVVDQEARLFFSSSFSFILSIPFLISISSFPCSATPSPSPLFCGFCLSPILSITTCTCWSRSLCTEEEGSHCVALWIPPHIWKPSSLSLSLCQSLAPFLCRSML